VHESSAQLVAAGQLNDDQPGVQGGFIMGSLCAGRGVVVHVIFVILVSLCAEHFLRGFSLILPNPRLLFDI